MTAYFSKRHTDSLREKKLPLSFSKSLRVSISRILERHSDHGGWNNSENWTFESAEEDLKTFWGRDYLTAFGEQDQRVRTDFAGMIRGGYPSEVLDAIEAWFDQRRRKPKSANRNSTSVSL